MAERDEARDDAMPDRGRAGGDVMNGGGGGNGGGGHGRRLTVYYDGGCPLCRMEIAHYAKRDKAGHVAFIDVAEQHAQTGGDLSREAALARFHVRDEKGRLSSGAAAFVRLWQELPGWRWAAVAARVPGVTWVMERGYRLVLPLRPRLARLVAGKRPASARRE